MITFENLNENQQRAVEWKDGPLLVLAGPGSGKTGVLTLRVARLIEEDEDASALALTFTNKAAAEMRERVDDLLGAHSERAHLCTFHSFATDVLGQHGSHLGIRPDFQPLARDEDRIAILEEVIRDLPDGGDELPSDRNNVLKLIDRLFSESYVGRGDSASLSSTPDWLSGLFRRYCDALSRPDCSGTSPPWPGWFAWAGRTCAWTNSRIPTGRNTISFDSWPLPDATICSSWRTTTRSSTSGMGQAPGDSATCAATMMCGPSSSRRAIDVRLQ